MAFLAVSSRGVRWFNLGPICRVSSPRGAGYRFSRLSQRSRGPCYTTVYRPHLLLLLHCTEHIRDRLPSIPGSLPRVPSRPSLFSESVLACTACQALYGSNRSRRRGPQTLCKHTDRTLASTGAGSQRGAGTAEIRAKEKNIRVKTGQDAVARLVSFLHRPMAPSACFW